MKEKKGLVFVIVFGLFCCAGALAQSAPEAGGNEIEVWAGGGPSVSGGTAGSGAFSAGLRYGWVLTDPHGPGFLRGNFEYVLDSVPLFLIFQPANTAYGIGFNPLGLKWDFVPHGRIVPYFELGGGVLFTDHNVPAGTSNVNFTPTAALGFHYVGDRMTWSFESRYQHISNAGLSGFNPGINTVQVRLGVGVIRHKH